MDMRAEFIRSIDGLYVGQLDEKELADFYDCVKHGYAVADYGGPAGFFLGLPRVRACYRQVGDQ